MSRQSAIEGREKARKMRELKKFGKKVSELGQRIQSLCLLNVYICVHVQHFNSHSGTVK